MRAIFITVFILFASSAILRAQESGFGCLGFMGGFVGYEIQGYQPEGLNTFIEDFNSQYGDSLSSPFSRLGNSSGLRFGMNIIRINYENIIFTLKGFYTGLKEESTSTVNLSSGSYNNSIELKHNKYGFGIDIGTPLTSFISWKVVEAEVLYNTFELTTTFNSTAGTKVSIYKGQKDSFGFTLGSGFIIHIIEDYISVEGTAGYTSFTVKSMVTDDEVFLPEKKGGSTKMENFIPEGGFTAIIQMNIGFQL